MYNIIVKSCAASDVLCVVRRGKNCASLFPLDFSQFGEPILRDLMLHVGHVSAKWREIGSELGMNEDELDIIQHDLAGTPNFAQSAMRVVFHKWNSAMTSAYSWENLAHALMSNAVGEKALVRVLYEKLSQQ